MSKLGIFDIVALAKAGYKASDIKELMSVEIEDPAPEDGGAEDAPDDQPGEPDKGTQPPAENPDKGSGQVKAGEPGKEDDIDYKKLYEDKCAELEKAQQTNVHQDQPEKPKTPTIDEIVRSFM